MKSDRNSVRNYERCGSSIDQWLSRGAELHDQYIGKVLLGGVQSVWRMIASHGRPATVTDHHHYSQAR